MPLFSDSWEAKQSSFFEVSERCKPAWTLWGCVFVWALDKITAESWQSLAGLHIGPCMDTISTNKTLLHLPAVKQPKNPNLLARSRQERWRLVLFLHSDNRSLIPPDVWSVLGPLGKRPCLFRLALHRVILLQWLYDIFLQLFGCLCLLSPQRT